jgi:large subunit ribosomal protein L13
MKTYSPKGAELQAAWWVVDAEGLVLGRLASAVAARLRGKDKPSFAPYLDGGDYVVIINASKIRVTGTRLDSKMYVRHSGYPGGFKTEPMRHLLGRNPGRILEKAIRGMLPKGNLGHQIIRKLKVYPGAEHPHASQTPTAWELGTAVFGGSEA